MGNGFNYIREIMAMNTDRTEQVISEFKFVGEIAKMPGWEFNRGKRGVRIVNYNLIQEWQEHTAQSGDVVMYENRLYVFAPDGMWHDMTATNVKTDEAPKTAYSKIPYGYLLIKKVHYSGDKTIVMWEDGTKTIVTRGENEVFDPEKGLVMAIAKKAYGNKGNYYNRIKKWLPEPISVGTNLDELPSPGVYYTKQTEDLIRETKDAIQDLIVDMTYNGATKAELVRAIKYSKEYIDWLKTPADENTDLIELEKLKEKYGIEELKEKYHKA